MTTPATQTDYWTPATEADKAQALASLAGLPSRATGEASITRASYYVALDGVTRYGLVEAVKAIMRGKLGHAFFPSPPELRMQCDQSMQPVIEAMERARRERREREEAEAFKPVHHSEETKVRVREIYEKFCRSFQTENDGAEIDAIRAKYDPDALAKIPDAPTTFTKPQIGRAA